MGFWSSIGSFVSGACSVISSVVSAVGKGIASVATSVASLGVSLAEKVGGIIYNIAVSLGILKAEEKLEEIGEKAMLSNKKPEDFDTMSDYIDHLRNDVPIDSDKFSKLSKEELLARSSIGSAIALKGVEEKLEMSISVKFLAEVALQKLETEEIVETIKAYKTNDLKLDDHALYLGKELNVEDSKKHSNALVEAYQKVDPEMGISQIEDKVMNLGREK